MLTRQVLGRARHPPLHRSWIAGEYSPSIQLTEVSYVGIFHQHLTAVAPVNTTLPLDWPVLRKKHLFCDVLPSMLQPFPTYIRDAGQRGRYLQRLGDNKGLGGLGFLVPVMPPEGSGIPGPRLECGRPLL